jgi:glycosyltransferase involved in cell wall biosynthesis
VVKQVTFAVPGDLATPTGGYVYDRRIVAELTKFGWEVDVIDIGDTFPRPSPGVRASAHLQLAAIPSTRLIVIDGLAFGVLPQTVRELAETRKLVALVHHPLAMETGLPEDEAAKFRASERLALMSARRVITTSMTTARLLRQMFAVPEDLLSVVRPGTDRAPFHERPYRKTVNLLMVGSIIPRKGYDLLVAALSRITDLPWRLVIAADAGRSPATARALEGQIAELHLTDRVELVGSVSPDRLEDFYRSADVFVLPSRYEGFGMAFTEAIAHGLPVIGTTAGAIPEAVPSGTGVLVPPDDAGALTVALMRLIGDPTERTRLSAGAWSAATTLPSWSEAGRQFAQALDAAA